jgi:ABC-type multidrug transport system fused ATPase/permease subunit
MNTIVGDRGVQLSGGQVQRIALARALIRKPRILILDEATSALDSESERLIQQSLNNLMGKITLFVIAHRLSTIKKSDNIYIIDKGEIIGSGDFDALMKTNNHFAKLVEMQKL